MDIVFIRGLEIATTLGVADWERQIRQTVLINVEMATDVKKAAVRDSLADTLDYSAVQKRLESFIGNTKFRLVETLAEETAKLLIADFSLRWLRLEINKPRPLSGRHVVGVVIERGARSNDDR